MQGFFCGSQVFKPASFNRACQEYHLIWDSSLISKIVAPFWPCHLSIACRESLLDSELPCVAEFYFGPAVFDRACLEYLLVSGRAPDVIHTHEWQGAAVPMIYWEKYHVALEKPRVMLTIHNMDNSGECRQDEFAYAGGLRVSAKGLRQRDYV